MKRLLCALLVVAACHHTRKTLVPDVPQTGDPQARARFLDAKSKFLRDGKQIEGNEFARIVSEYPADPIAPWAELYAGIAAVKAHDFAQAEQQLAKVIEANRDPGLVTRAQLFLGIAKNYEGDARRARELLAHSDKAVENDDERTEYLAAVAYATALGDKPLAALPWLDELWPRVQPAERAVIVQRIQDLVAAAPPDQLKRAFDDASDRKGASYAIAGSRLALIAAQNGDADGAAKLRDAVAGARASIGLPRTIAETEVGPASGGAGDPSLLGAALPFGNGVAERAAEGLALAAGAPDGKGVVAIETRPATDKAAAAEAVDQLARANVIAVVGPIGDGSVDAAAGRAEGLGLPLLSLSPHAEQRAGGRFVFHIRHSPEARARELARRALALGVKRFAVLAPDSEYGKTTTAAFTAVIDKGGGKIVANQTYPVDRTSFASTAKKLDADIDAIFVADEAKKLELIAPALAAAGKVPSPPGTKKKKGKNAGTPVLLLSTAEDLKAGYLAEAARHSEGALLAPGFYPDDADPVTKPFLDRFTAAFGRPPGATEAYAYDAAQLAAAAGAGGRAALAQTLAKGQLAGVTGAIRFDDDHRRADPGVIYTVVEETGNTYAIRVAK